MKSSLIIAFVATAMMGTVQAQTTKEWSLKDCIEHAVEHNISIRQQAIQTDQNRNTVNTAKYARLPNLNGGANQGWTWGRTPSPTDNTYVNTSSTSTGFSVSTSVPLFTGFRLHNTYVAAKLNLQASLEDLQKAKEDISISVTSAYMQALFDNEILTVAQEQVELSKQQVERLVRLKEVGKSSYAEVAEAKSRLAQDQLSAVQARNAQQLSLLTLSQLLELPTTNGFSIQKPTYNFTPETPTPPDAIYNAAVTQRPSIKAAQLRVKSSQRNIKVAKSAYYPELSFNAGLSTGYYTLKNRPHNTFSSQLDDNLNKQIGFTLSIPIFNRFSTRNSIRNAKLQHSSYAFQLQDEMKKLYKEIQQSWYNAVGAEAKYNSSTAAVAANKASFDLITKKFENGKATSIEYNEAKLNLMKAVSEKLKAKYEFLFQTKILNFYKGIPIE